jgi:hypothetical protein
MNHAAFALISVVLLAASLLGCTSESSEGGHGDGDATGDGDARGDGDGDGHDVPTFQHPADERGPCDVTTGQSFDWETFCQSDAALVAEFVAGCGYTHLQGSVSSDFPLTNVVLDADENIVFYEFVNALSVPHEDEEIPDCTTGAMPACDNWSLHGTGSDSEFGALGDLCLEKTGSFGLGGAGP